MPTVPSLWLWLSGAPDLALQQVAQHHHIVTAVAVGGYNIGKEGKLSGSVNTTVARKLAASGFEVHALMSGGLDALRSLFDSPQVESADHLLPASGTHPPFSVEKTMCGSVQ